MGNGDNWMTSQLSFDYGKKWGKSMNYSQTLLTSLKSTCGGISDYKAAQLLGCTRQFISRVKSGEKNLSPEMAILAADLAKLDKQKVLIRMLIENSKSDEMIKILEGIEERIKH